MKLLGSSLKGTFYENRFWDSATYLSELNFAYFWRCFYLPLGQDGRNSLRDSFHRLLDNALSESIGK